MGLWKNKYFKILLLLILVAIGSELILRKAFGFCDTVLMEADKNYEYIAQPNQTRHRFGQEIIYNSLSMRNTELDSSKINILCFGDSVINGGVLTDHDSLATTMLSEKVSDFYHTGVEFLNVSAGSWGPDNCFAYLKQKGDFDAKLLLLFVNSHDAYDTMEFEKIIDIDPSFPSHQYSSALYELWDRYLFPRLKKIVAKDDNSPTENLGISKKKAGQAFNSGFENFISYSKQHGIPLMVYLHAERDELNAGHYNEEGKQILKLLEDNDIPLVTDLQSGLTKDDFRDNIHLNEKGQKNIATNIFEAIKAKDFAFLMR